MPRIKGTHLSEEEINKVSVGRKKFYSANPKKKAVKKTKTSFLEYEYAINKSFDRSIQQISDLLLASKITHAEADERGKEAELKHNRTGKGLFKGRVGVTTCFSDEISVYKGPSRQPSVQMYTYTEEGLKAHKKADRYIRKNAALYDKQNTPYSPVPGGYRATRAANEFIRVYDENNLYIIDELPVMGPTSSKAGWMAGFEPVNDGLINDVPLDTSMNLFNIHEEQSSQIEVSDEESGVRLGYFK